MSSEWVKSVFPPQIRYGSSRLFETQRLMNDLLFPDATPARQTSVLHQVLRGTPMRFPVLLMMNSDPDIQAIVAKLPSEERRKPEWSVDVAAGYMADRDLRLAWHALQQAPEKSLPLEGLMTYLEDTMSEGSVRRRRLGAEP
jgi:hypothetical protein